jgi:hypothetical protein
MYPCFPQQVAVSVIPLAALGAASCCSALATHKTALPEEHHTNLHFKNPITRCTIISDGFV